MSEEAHTQAEGTMIRVVDVSRATPAAWKWPESDLEGGAEHYYDRTMNNADIKPMADAIYADKVRRARAAPKEQKMGLGPELFAEACVRMKDGIRHQFPHAIEPEVHALLLRRLDRLRQVAEHGIYRRQST